MEEYIWDLYNRRSMGEYLDKRESVLVERFFMDNEVENCLDLFCGSGRISTIISRYSGSVVGLDMDMAGLKKYSRRGGNISAVNCDANHVPFRNSSFDCIVCIQGPELLSGNIRNFFRMCNDLLTDEGYLLFNIANRDSYKKIIHKMTSRDSQRFYLYSYGEIVSYLVDEGFDVLSCEGYNWAPFNRDSDNSLIKVIGNMEVGLRLNRYLRRSPWVFFIARKKKLRMKE